MALSKIDQVAEEICALPDSNEEISKSYPRNWPSVTKFVHISLGDHVCYYKFPYYKHGIIIETNRSKQIYKLLRYHLTRWEIDSEEIEYKDGKCYLLQSKSEINLLRADYTGKCFSPDITVQRALARCNEKRYDPITNYARAFPRWCKTGKGGLTAINQVKLYQSRIVIDKIQILTKGDHIAFDRGSYFHHAIVLSVSPLENKIKVVHFTTGGGKGKGQVKQEEITRHEQPGTLYKLTYRERTESDPDVIVSRASLIKANYPKYNVLYKNCEHMATWCKTGIWHSGQVKSFAVYFIKHLFTFGIKMGAQLVVRLVEGSFACLVDKFTSLFVDISGTQVDIIGSVAFCILDIAYAIYDVRKRNKRGELKGDALQEEIIKRVVRCLVVDSSVVLGSILGQLFIPLPILNSFIGGLCGLALGELINFLIQKIVALLKGKAAKMFWEKKDQLVDNATKFREMLSEFSCHSHTDSSCIGPA